MRRTLGIVSIITRAAALLMLAASIIDYGFPLNAVQSAEINHFFFIVWLIKNIWYALDSQLVRNGVLLLLSIMEVSDYLTHILGKKTNPSAVLAMSFLFIILLGSILLLMPNCTIPSVNLSWVDSLFTATSAVCVNGLITIDLATTFTFSGKLIVLALIQIGGLGVMTITSFFALFFMGNVSLNNKMIVKHTFNTWNDN